MTRPIAVLRPEPGNAATAARIAAAGGTALRLPLFAVRGLAWEAPDPAGYDALLLTSANAPRHAGAALARLAALPVFAVGDATAKAARAAGLSVRMTGTGGVADVLAGMTRAGIRRALHLAGRDRTPPALPVARVVTVYASEEIAPDPVALAPLAGSVALVHSPRAGARLAALVDAAGVARGRVRVAAISAAAARTAGGGWDALAIAAHPDDAALLAVARSLAD